MTNRKFHRTVLRVVILSEEPYKFHDLEQVNHDITEGDCSGEVIQLSAKVLDGKQAARALRQQASDPSFFQLTNQGDDIDEETTNRS